MKKILLSLFTVITGLGFAQEIKIYNGPSSTVDISGTTINIDGPSYEGYLYVHCDAPAAFTNLKVTRKQVVAPQAPVTEQLCWGSNFEIGDCYDLDLSVAQWTSPLKGVTANDPGMLEPKIYLNGATESFTQTYYVLNDQNVLLDSVTVHFPGTLSTGKIDAKAAFNIQTYPNPASDYLTISANNSAEYFVKITDVLGNVVFEDKFNSIKKVDVNNYKTGVYIVSLYNNKSLINTKRVVVKH